VIILHSKNATMALIFSTLAMMASFIVWNVFSPIASQLEVLFQLSTIQKSILIATPVLLGSIMRVPMGIYTDRYGGRRVFVITMLGLILPLLYTAGATSFTSLLLGALMLGMAGTAFSISLTYVSGWYPPEKQGLILGLAGLGNLGVAIASYLIPLAFAQFGLEYVLYGLCVLMLVMSAIFWICTKDVPANPGSKKTFKAALRVLRFKSTWYLCVFYFLTFGGFVAFSVYLPTFLKELFELNATEAGLKTAGFVVLATLVRPFGGYLADRLGSYIILATVFAGITATALLVAFSLDDFTLFSIGVLTVSILLGIGNGAVFKMVPEVGNGNTGAVTGIVGAAGGVGGFFPPILLGFVKSYTDTYTLGFILLALFACLCLWLNQSTKRLQNSKNSHVKPDYPGAASRIS
jgi:MFS transporter, NNP family, nitrate/nitrite transporter